MMIVFYGSFHWFFVTARPLAIGFVAFLAASLRRTEKYASRRSSSVPRLSSKGRAVMVFS